MKYITTYNLFERSTFGGDYLLIVDVQKSFSKFFNDNYLNELKKYCSNFKKVYQIFDNHIDGKNIDKDYLYDINHDVDYHEDLYDFPNQIDIIEKRYNYDVDVDFYKNILDLDTYKNIKNKEDKKLLKVGDYFKTLKGTIIVYIGNNHNWYHVPKKLYKLFIDISNAQKEGLNNKITLVGGAFGECLKDIEIAAKSLGVELILNKKYIYSATECPIK
jgi:hypothetical protein